MCSVGARRHFSYLQRRTPVLTTRQCKWKRAKVLIFALIARQLRQIFKKNTRFFNVATLAVHESIFWRLITPVLLALSTATTKNYNTFYTFFPDCFTKLRVFFSSYRILIISWLDMLKALRSFFYNRITLTQQFINSKTTSTTINRKPDYFVTSVNVT